MNAPRKHRRTLPRPDDRRKALFRAALGAAGLTQSLWAEQQGISASHVSQVLSGKRESRSLVGKIDAFVTRELDRVAKIRDSAA